MSYGVREYFVVVNNKDIIRSLGHYDYVQSLRYSSLPSIVLNITHEVEDLDEH